MGLLLSFDCTRPPLARMSSAGSLVLRPSSSSAGIHPDMKYVEPGEGRVQSKESSKPKRRVTIALTHAPNLATLRMPSKEVASQARRGSTGDITPGSLARQLISSIKDSPRTESYSPVQEPALMPPVRRTSRVGSKA